MNYQPLILSKHPKPAPEKHSAESRYWRSFKSPVFVKEYAPVTSLHFTLAKPHKYAVTAATRVHIYAPRTQKIIKTIARFKDVARSGFIRDDGKLLVAGDDSGLIQVSHPSLTWLNSSHFDSRFLMSTHELFFAPSMHISSLCMSPGSRRWIIRGCFRALMTPRYASGTCPHNRPSPLSLLTPTTSALAKFPPQIHISYSRARTMARSASSTLVRANVNSLWVQPRGGPVPARCLSSKCSCTHRGRLPCPLQVPSFVYGTSLQVVGVFVLCQITKRQSHLSLSTPTPRDY
jgi:hypothetical protein